MVAQPEDVGTPYDADRIVLLDLSLFVVVVGVIVGLSPANLLVLAVLAVLSAGRLVLVRDRAFVLIFVVGAAAGVAFDMLRVWSGVYAYTHADLGWFPIFMPVAWGQIFLTIRNVLVALDQRARVSWARRLPGREFGATVLLFVVSVPALHLLHEHVLAAIVVALGCFASFVFLVGRPGDVAAGLLFAVLGPGSEVIFVSGDLYRFCADRVEWVPLWLPVVWMVYALVIRRIVGRLEALLSAGIGGQVEEVTWTR